MGESYLSMVHTKHAPRSTALLRPAHRRRQQPQGDLRASSSGDWASESAVGADSGGFYLYCFSLFKERSAGLATAELNRCSFQRLSYCCGDPLWVRGCDGWVLLSQTTHLRTLR